MQWTITKSGVERIKANTLVLSISNIHTSTIARYIEKTMTPIHNPRHFFRYRIVAHSTILSSRMERADRYCHTLCHHCTCESTDSLQMLVHGRVNCIEFCELCHQGPRSHSPLTLLCSSWCMGGVSRIELVTCTQLKITLSKQLNTHVPAATNYTPTPSPKTLTISEEQPTCRIS